MISAHVDAVAPVVLALAVLLLVGKLAAEIALRLRQPAVLGELVAGIVLGNLGVVWFEALKTDPTIDVLAGIGVLILLFQVGVHETVTDMLRVGASSLAVALIGIVVPFGLGWAVSAWLMPDASVFTHAFIGATLCATSVGITARVFQDLGWSRSREARIILGAAVIDDVVGLVILGGVSGAVLAAGRGESLSTGAVARPALAAAAFLAGAIVIGRLVVPRLFAAGALLHSRGVFLTLCLSFCFLMSGAASLVGLAPIIGAFAAGLILEETHFLDFTARGERTIDELLRPIADFLVPIFFVLMGLRTDVTAFADPRVLLLAAALIVVAIAGKQASALGVLTPGVDRLSVGLGMVPRGEVGLIFANIGLSLTIDGQPVIGGALFSAIVMTVVVTTMVTPPALRWSLGRRGALAASSA